MTLDEFYEAFAIAAPNYQWGHTDPVIWTIGDWGFCPITATYHYQTKCCLDVSQVNEAADLLGLSQFDRKVVMCAADNDIMKYVSVEERDTCRRKLLEITKPNAYYSYEE